MKRNLGNMAILALVLITILVWLVFPPLGQGVQHYARAYAGEVLGSIVIVLMSFSLVLAARPKWAEPYFGGLDRMYLTHRRTSTAAFLILFVHLLVVPITVDNLRLGNYLAIIAFLGIVAIVLPTLAPRIPFLSRLAGKTYEGWKSLHRFIGIFFIAGFVHSLTVNAPSAFVAITWTQIFFILGTVAYLYAEVFGRFFRKHVPYIVEAVNRPNRSTTEVRLRARAHPIARHRAGQFLFVRFPGHEGLDEAHPFTISSDPSEAALRLTIKACGDFTRRLFGHLQEGADAVVEGPYGMFDYKTGGPRQIWIAGGIGVTPFLAFLRDLDETLERQVFFHYVVRHREEAVFVEEIEALAAKHPRLQVDIRYSSTQGPLAAEEVLRTAGGDPRQFDAYLCGPLPMMQAFERTFIEAGLRRERIHYEEFNFR